MGTRDKLTKICINILVDMYKEADPPLDFEYVLNHPKEFTGELYNCHYLDNERQLELRDKHIKRRRLSTREKSAVEMFLLKWAPTGVRR